MTALAEHIAQQHARGDRLPLLALCPVRGCLNFAPVGECCQACNLAEAAALEAERAEEWTRERIRGICS